MEDSAVLGARRRSRRTGHAPVVRTGPTATAVCSWPLGLGSGLRCISRARTHNTSNMFRSSDGWSGQWERGMSLVH